MKLYQLLNADKAIEALGESKNLKAKTAYTVAKDIKMINEEVDNYKKVFNDMLLKYGHEQDGNYVISEQDETFPVFIKEHNELVNTELDLNLVQLSIDDLDGAELTPNQLIALDFLISD